MSSDFWSSSECIEEHLTQPQAVQIKVLHLFSTICRLTPSLMKTAQMTFNQEANALAEVVPETLRGVEAKRKNKN